jgi:hypothetical protein
MPAVGFNYNCTFETTEKPVAVYQKFVTSAAAASGYTISGAGDNTIIIHRKFTPTPVFVWAIVLAITCALTGLLLLLYRVDETCTIALHETESGGTAGVVTGVVNTDLNARLSLVISTLA